MSPPDVFSIMPHPVIGPMEDHVHCRRRPSKPVPIVHGGTSLQLSDGGKSPVLEAHPGSPVDLSSARRPSLAASLASARSSYSSSSDVSLREKSPRLGQVEEGVIWDGVAAKGSISIIVEKEKEKEITRPLRKAYVGMQPFHIPEKVPEHEEMIVTTTPIRGDDAMSMDTVMDHEMDFQFDTDGGTWVTANPSGLESRTSLSTAITSASTMVEDNRYSTALTLDTSVASSAASMMSSTGSTYSLSTNTSDVYGCEEELDRKSSIDITPWDREFPRRAPLSARANSGPRAVPTRKRKGLLYRVLNMSGRKEDIPTIPEATTPVLSEQFRNNCT